MTTTTRQVGGHKITLTAGRRYIATRPMASRKGQTFDVSIFDVTEGYNTFVLTPVKVIADQSYEAANKAINRFNNGQTSFEGRIW